MNELWNLMNPSNEEYLIKSTLIELLLSLFNNFSYNSFNKSIRDSFNQNDEKFLLDESRKILFNKLKKELLKKIYDIKIRQNSFHKQSDLINNEGINRKKKINKSIRFSPYSTFKKNASPIIKFNSTIIGYNFSINGLENKKNTDNIGKQRYTINETILNEIKDCTFNPIINISSRKVEAKHNV